MDSTEKYDLGKNSALKRRYDKTLKFVLGSAHPPLRILDLGIKNPLSEILNQKGFEVYNTQGEDLDETPECVRNFSVDAVTAFEIFEHLLNPLGVLKILPGKRLIASVPLSLWFAKSYRHPTDKWDRHFHEFEDWQFDWLVEAAGWQIVRREYWKSPIGKIGIRPFLRLITPRYYIIEAVRKKTHI